MIAPVADYGRLIPVNVITGFLGSGKTTLLKRLLASPRLANVAVFFNEFGEVGLDHLLLQRVDEGTVVLQSGCVCCNIRSDLREAIRDLYSKRERGQVPCFDRMVIETTGLADPVPIIYTLMAEPVIRHHFRLGNIITTIDAVNGALHLAENPESAKQVAVADRLVLTKTDISDPRKAGELRATLRRLNPSAPLFEAAAEPVEPNDLLTNDVYDPDSKTEEVRRWFDEEALSEGDHGPVRGHDVNRHDRRIHAFCLTFDEPLNWTAFGIWLTMLLHSHGENVLRVKGMLNVIDVPTPVVIHGVQHIVHPPVHLELWPDDERRSRIVFIVRDLERCVIERSLAAFNELGNPQ